MRLFRCGFLPMIIRPVLSAFYKCTLLYSSSIKCVVIEVKEWLKINNKVIEWLKINKLSLNKNTSNYMIFHMPKRKYKFLHTNIDKVEEFNLLLLMIDTHLKLKKHTDKNSNKYSKIT